MTIRIEVISDVVCPWCFIGKRRLEQAVALLAAHAPDAQPAVEVVWRPFQLNPQLPEQGMTRTDYVQQKFGERAGQIYTRVAQVGREQGIDFQFERIVRQPNTTPAHQLIELAGRHACQDAMVEALFRAYFLDGVDLTRRENLLDLAQQAGLDRALAAICLDDPEVARAVRDAQQRAQELGVEGVPFFIFNERLAVSGAQTPDVLMRAMQQARTESITFA